ncbi:MAG: helix-turn-helix domain-containing protein [Desulfobulbus oligotrophicus]|jgi:predicted site-specific integrase-resolvase|nr:helix-turn-helix domain-containing protein [Desulfobulbus oligotrophicus]
MTNQTSSQHVSSGHEYLDLQQAAVICSVSDERFEKWIEKGVIPVIDIGGKKLIHSHDLVQHLVRHNIPIPARLLQGNSKKVLFVLAGESIHHAVTTEVIWALYRLRQQTSYIFDVVRLDDNIELKIITFNPDKIVLLQEETSHQDTESVLHRSANSSIPIFTLTNGRTSGLDQFLNE